MHSTLEEREAFLKDAGYHILNYPARGLYVDLLTDSGTAAIPQSSLSALLLSDESYARQNWYYAFLDAFRDYCERGAEPQKAFLKLMDPNLSNAEFRETFMAPRGYDSMINWD